MGDVRLADVLVAPSPVVGNELFKLADGSPAVGLDSADSEMNVSTHLAGENSGQSKTRSVGVLQGLPMIVSSNSPPFSNLKSFPAPRANTMLSLYS
jgi:hypothetical protein